MPLLLDRRAFTCATACASALATIPRPARAFKIPVGQQIQCRILRHGSDIGRAHYTFDQAGGELHVAMQVDLVVKIGFIPVFRYKLVNEERWRGDTLLSFRSQTNDNDKHHYASATRQGDILTVSGSGAAPYTAPPGALATTYWNPRTLTNPLINAQDGRLLAIAIVKQGPSQAVLSSGQTVPANEYKMSGDLKANLWYDDSLTWTGMQFFAHDGSVLLYEKMV